MLSAFSEEDERVISIVAGHLGALWAHNELLERTGRLALQDPLTGLWNRRFIFDRLESEASRCGRYGCVFSVVMIDLRNFKLVNDRFGHPAGDRILVEMSSFFRKSLRDSDIVSRYGGDEFLMLLPETDFAEASRILDRLAKDLDRQRIRIESTPVLFDCGFASFPADGREVRALIQTADERLYCEKASRKRGKGVKL
jgi:diguanylate cyclase (GGDEF)-like protein